MNCTQLQLKTGFIDRIADNDIILQRVTDGYVNATAMCRAVGKQMNDYSRLESTKSFIHALSCDTGIPVSGLVQLTKGGA